MKNNNFILKILPLLVIILGIITPFIDSFVVIEMFYLLIPFGLILLFSIIILIFNLFKYKKKIFKQNSTLLILIIPVFLLSQIISTFVIDKIQKFRSESIIGNLEKNYKIFPNSLNTSFGLKYHKTEFRNEFRIEYNRGFFVREIYSSDNGKWESFGWND